MTSASGLTSAALLAVAAMDVPVEPDAEQARSWLTAELTDPVYHQAPSLLERLLAWIQEQLAALGPAIAGINPLVAALVVGGAVLVVVVLALLVTGPVRRARLGQRASHEVLVDELRSAAELRAAADAAAEAGRYHDAVLDRFRAILRSLEERTLLDPLPGRTAHEAAEASAARLPTCAQDLRAAGRLFDDVAYGDLEATSESYRWLTDLDRRVAETRPTSSATPALAEVGRL